MELDKQNMQASLADLKYVIECIIPNIAYVVKLLCKFTSRRMRSIDMLLKES